MQFFGLQIGDLTMLCERAQELFSDYHEGAVKPAMLVPLESHLDECAECKTKLDGIRDIWNLLDSAPLVEPPPGFRAAVWARIDAIEAEKARKKRPQFAFDWRSLFRPATLGWAAAVLAVLMLAPVVVPGARTVAGAWFPWSLIYHGPARTQVTLSQPQMTIENGQKWVELQVSNTGTSAARVEVRVEGSSSSPVLVEAPAGTSKWYRVGPAPQGTAHVRAMWQEGDGLRSEDYTVVQ